MKLLKKPFISLSLPVLIILLTSGCITPKNVEFFQKKVPTPLDTKNIQEDIRLLSWNIRNYVDQLNTQLVSLSQNVTNEVTLTNVVKVQKTVTNLVQLSHALLVITGPPKSLNVKGNAVEIVRYTLRDYRKYLDKLHKQQLELAELQGKKIEGTGLIQMSYFTYLFLVFVGLVFIYVIFRVLYLIFFQPYLSGLQVIRHLEKALSEVIHGGEVFKDKLEQIIQDRQLKQQIREIFKESHKEVQSEDTRLEVLKRKLQKNRL